MALTRRFWDDLVELDRPMIDLYRSFVSPSYRPRVAMAEMPYMPPTDVYSHDGDMVVRVELPGIDPEKDVKVTLVNGMLDIKGERKQEKEIREEGYVRRESIYGAFERQIRLPEGTKESDIKADYKDGVLEVVVSGAAKSHVKPVAKEIPIHKKTALPIKH